MLWIQRFIAAAVSATACMGCLGETGGDLIQFRAFALGAGAGDGSYAFESGRGYQVELTRARIHVGALYLNRSRPSGNNNADTSCTLPGIYVAEVTSGFDVDALDPEPQEFPARGFATTERALTGEIWLSGGPIDVVSDPTVILDIAGVARKGGDTYPFEGEITIGANRVVPPDPVLPGREPICKQRVVTPILTDIVPTEGGSLALRIDPSGWFGNVEFATLEEEPGNSGIYRFLDKPSNQASNNLYDGLQAAGRTTYSFEWDPGEP
jgi:hypothetical protein